MMSTAVTTAAEPNVSMPAIVERRAHRRMSATSNTTSLEWRQDGSHRSSVARVMDISAGGALLVSEEVPPVTQGLWIRLEGPAATPWIGGRVVRVAGENSMAIAFDRPCPPDFFESAVLGISFGNLL